MEAYYSFTLILRVWRVVREVWEETVVADSSRTELIVIIGFRWDWILSKQMNFHFMGMFNIYFTNVYFWLNRWIFRIKWTRVFWVDFSKT
jgi:hypothetical protein